MSHIKAVELMLADMEPVPPRLKPVAAMARGLAMVLDEGVVDPATFREYRLSLKELREVVDIDSADSREDSIETRLGRARVRDGEGDG